MNERIYMVASNNARRLVMASSPAQALRHVAQAQYEVKPANALEVAELMGAGSRVERAGNADQASLELSVVADA